MSSCLRRIRKENAIVTLACQTHRGGDRHAEFACTKTYIMTLLTKLAD